MRVRLCALYGGSQSRWADWWEELSAILGARGAPEGPVPAHGLLEMGLARLGFSSVEEFNAQLAADGEAERIDLLNSLFMLLISAY